jgi:predicted PurR-regulated permease PerM
MATPRPSSLTAFLILFLLSAAAFFWMVSDFIVAVFMGQVLAYLLAPLYRRLRGALRPAPAAILSVFALFLGVMAPLAGFGTIVVHDAFKMERGIAESGGLTAEALVDKLDRFGLSRFGDPARLKARAREGAAAAAKGALGAAAGMLRSIPRSLIGLALALVSAVFLLKDEDSLLRLALAPLPLEPETVAEAQEAFQSTAAATVWSAMAVAVVQAACVGLCFVATGLHGAALAAGLAFIAAWVPLISSTPIWVAAGSWLLYQGLVGRWAALCGFALVGYAADHLLRPYLLRGRARLHPLMGLVSVLGGIEAFGLSGVFVGPILASLVAALYRVWPRTAARYSIDVKPTVVGPGGSSLA